MLLICSSHDTLKYFIHWSFILGFGGGFFCCLFLENTLELLKGLDSKQVIYVDKDHPQMKIAIHHV